MEIDKKIFRYRYVWRKLEIKKQLHRRHWKWEIRKRKCPFIWPKKYYRKSVSVIYLNQKAVKTYMCFKCDLFFHFCICYIIRNIPLSPLNNLFANTSLNVLQRLEKTNDYGNPFCEICYKKPFFLSHCLLVE